MNDIAVVTIVTTFYRLPCNPHIILIVTTSNCNCNLTQVKSLTLFFELLQEAGTSNVNKSCRQIVN